MGENLMSADYKHFGRTATLSTAAAIALMIGATQVNAAKVDTQESTEVTTERAGVSFSARANMGYLTGQAHEYVYWQQQGGHTASELIWDIDSMTMIGIGGTIKPLEWMSINGDVWFNITDGDGNMVDYDWMAPGMDWTDRSTHEDTDVSNGFMFDMNMEMTAFKAGSISFSGILGYRRDSFEWKANGGSYIYSENGFRDNVGSFTNGELVCTYEQTFDVPYFGLGVVGDFDQFHFTAKFITSMFVSGEAIDHHHLRDLVIYNDFSGESMWAVDLAASYDITPSIGLEVAYFYESYDTMTGDSTWNFSSGNSVSVLSDGAGADLEFSMFSLNVIYTF